MSDPPSKRRKIRSPSPLSIEKPAPSTQHIKMDVTWPSGEVPVEIFRIIISFLPRSSIQSMRLVNREFEEKVSEDLFRTVVVPFRPEIYGIAEEPARIPQEDAFDGHNYTTSHDSLQPSAAVMLQDKGMRVFQGFGRHIHKFAMSFEIEYDNLMEPPAKSDQEAITTFWGIYRWPFKKYNRFAQLEGLEQTADETMTMTKALGYISNAKELGLSIDGGLGWLAGPDINHKVNGISEKASVFGDTRFPADDVLTLSGPNQATMASLVNSVGNQLSTSTPHTPINELSSEVRQSRVLEQMLREAGYEGPSLSQSVQTLLESEGLHQNSLLHSTGRINQTLDNNAHIVRRINSAREVPAERERLRTEADATTCYPLKPNDLTNSQKEMLLETEWAQRAFMQSYAIAIIDNPTTFQNVETLTIARLPSCHLTILRRSDFWSSLSQLATVSLSIIPDWREVIKLPTSWVEDVRVAPSQAVRELYQLLKDHIAPRKSIKSLHIEWLCGGEYSSGIFSRNQHVLAAPLLPEAVDMLTTIDASSPILSLPFVEHLSMKNCWLSPHVLLHFIRILKDQALRTISLDSVSLSAPITRGVQPGPLPHQQVVPQLNNNNQPPNMHATLVGAAPPLLQGPFIQFNGTQLGQGITPPQPQANPFAWLDAPRYGSWPYIIDQVCPGVTLGYLRYVRDLGPKPPISQKSNLIKMSFNSCGYVRLQVALDHSVIDPPEQHPAEASAIAKRRAELESYMMKPQEHTLGTIINHMDQGEVVTLENAWDLTIGWSKENKIMAVQALVDGVKRAGQGRFSGTIAASTHLSSSNFQ